ncbi:MAG: glucose-6-phosphate dehydrogenase [Proteobacteria bacterium]|nr:glucose-6-phosphate dehydrogenase [Pseudomonadota bacterium]MBU1737223.1 glucose-6-phosphate dehydrogenase [Pseudomonadota bacterium]
MATHNLNFGSGGSSASCRLPSGDLDPCTIVIFGATGDLTSRKLLPALFNLYRNRNLPEPCVIVGCGRTDLDSASFRKYLREKCPDAATDSGEWVSFMKRVHYQQVLYDSLGTYQELAVYLEALDKSEGTTGNRIYDLAVPPALYPVIAKNLTRAGLATEENGRWTRIVVEKPFGSDLASARELDRVIHEGFTEEQIFRIDHYLAKETVQNIMMLRFANSIFEPLWNRNYIEYVGIAAAEELGVGTRAGYYEKTGVVRDMFQNHLLQLLSLIAMEPPAAFSPDRIRDEKVKVFRSLQPFTSVDLDEDLILGQYGPDRTGKVPGYRQEAGISSDSLTPTFAMMRLFLDNWRWQGVPFYLYSGKRLARKDTRMVIQFKHAPHSMFREVLGENITANRLTMAIFPEEEIRLSFQTKVPGARICLQTMNLDFNYSEDFSGPVLAAYEKVLLDCMQGDQMFFWRQDAVELAWEFLTPILEECAVCDDRPGRLHFYEAGSWGPEAAGEWLSQLMK